MTKVLVVHGAGINMRGKSQIEIFGSDTMEDYSNQIREYGEKLHIDVDIFHSNIVFWDNFSVTLKIWRRFLRSFLD